MHEKITIQGMIGGFLEICRLRLTIKNIETSWHVLHIYTIECPTRRNVMLVKYALQFYIHILIHIKWNCKTLVVYVCMKVVY